MTQTPQTSGPEFGGKCAFGTGMMGAAKAPQGKAEHALTIDGKTYYFSGGMQKWIASRFPGVIAKAQRKWAAQG